MHLDGCTFEAGDHFHIDVNLFDLPAKSTFLQVFEEFAHEGLGRERRRVELELVSGDPICLDLNEIPLLINHLQVTFLTPTELKGGTIPTFPLLAARVRDRISTLNTLYGEGPLLIDFPTYAAHAETIQMTSCTTANVHMQRRSTRTGETHSLGGFVGEAEYHGNLGEFVSLFSVARYTGVGRQTVWGKGQIGVEYGCGDA